MPFCTLNAAFAIATATFAGGAYMAHKTGADANSALGQWKAKKQAAKEAEELAMAKNAKGGKKGKK